MENLNTYSENLNAESTCKNDYVGDYIDFHALHTAYCNFEWARHYVNAIYACTAIYCYWTHIRECQMRNGTSSDMDFISRNMNNYVESPKLVNENIRKAVMNVVRMATATNCVVSRNSGRRFLVCRLSRDNDGHYDFSQAEMLVKEIANEYEHYFNKPITETRWDRIHE